MQSFIYGVQCNGQEGELLNCSKSEVIKVSCESVAGIVCQGIKNSQHHGYYCVCFYLHTSFYLYVCSLIYL